MAAKDDGGVGTVQAWWIKGKNKRRRASIFIIDQSVLKEASRLYGASLVRDFGPELRPGDYKKKSVSEDDGLNGETCSMGEKDPSTLEDLAVAAKVSMEMLRPDLQRVYMARASAYRDTLRRYIGGRYTTSYGDEGKRRSRR